MASTGRYLLTNFVFLAVVLHRRKRTSSSDECFSIGPGIEISWFCFVEACRIAERKDHGTIDMAGHFLDNLLGKGFGFRRCSYQNMRLDLLDHRVEIMMIFALPFTIISSILYLSRSERISMGLEQQARLIDTPGRLASSPHVSHSPNLFGCFFLGFAAFGGNSVT